MSDSETEARAPLTVQTDLTLSVDGRPVDVSSTGERLFVEFPSLSAAVRAFARSPPTARRRLHELLTTTDLTVELRVRDRTVALVGAEARPGGLSKRAGVAPVELRVGGVFGAVGQELSAAGRRLGRLNRRLRGR
ncbi:hypothetical protein SAMN04487947_3609 [Halogeometricum rufum]|uniref:Uncharacterized protein n=1 Tax=Halogeometricum rufum TaxID=553469 RepID=A0A1I6IRX5_9EURY|nr:hypothetical protein [Halogeometricum rufum]SFR69389.1 hypothetical protein SAMN04487947_3609 [Halogeometricum rufum]